MGSVAVVHTNTSLKHQLEWGDALVRGFLRHGVQAWQTADRNTEADIHVVQGPHYAKQRWIDHPRTILLDRSYYNDPDDVSLGWLQPDGGRRFKFNHMSEKAEIAAEPWATRTGTALVLGDYGQDCTALIKEAQKHFDRVYYRCHPAEQRQALVVTIGGDLGAAIGLAGTCIGHRTTTLCDAILRGIPVICLDKTNIVWDVASHSFDEPLFRGDRSQWLVDLSWTNFNINEIASGLAWEHLREF